MNAREVTEKVTKNKFRQIIQTKKNDAKQVNVKKVLSPEKLEAKAKGYEKFLAEKDAKKRRRAS